MLLPSNPLLHPYATSPPAHTTSCYSNLVAKQHPTSMYVHLGPHPTHYKEGFMFTVCFRMCSHLGQIRKLLDTGKCMQRYLKVEDLASSLCSCQMPRLDQYQARPLWIAPASLKGSELEWGYQKQITSQVVSGTIPTNVGHTVA